MQLIQALKRAISIARKGEVVVLMPPVGGLPSKVAAKKDGLWISWVIDEVVETPGVMLDVSDLQVCLKSKSTEYQLDRIAGIPTTLWIKNAGGSVSSAKCAPLLQLSDWFPPWPESELSGPIESTLLLAAVHATTDDVLRPELGHVALTPGGTYAGDEAQFVRTGCAWAATALHGRECVLIPSIMFHKFPDEPVRFYFAHDRAYFRIGDELRVSPIPTSTWWPAVQIVDTFASKALHEMASFEIKRKNILEPFKVAKKIADRRLVALGVSGQQPWIRIGDVMSPLPGTVAGWSGPPWQIVVDGNRLLDILKALDAETLIVHFEPFNPRTPVGFSHTHGSVVEGLCPLLPIG